MRIGITYLGWREQDRNLPGHPDENRIEFKKEDFLAGAP